MPTTTVDGKIHQRVSWATVAGLFFALIVPLLTYLAGQIAYGSAQSPGRTAVGITLHWINLAAVVAIVIFAEQRPLSSIGLRALRWWTIPLGALGGALITVASGALVGEFGLRSDITFVTSLQALPVITRVLLAVTAGVFEETLYRGYAIERITSLCGNQWLAGAATVVLFTLMHAPAVGWLNLLPVGIVGVLVTLLYLWRRDLVVNVIAHTTIDAIGLLLAPLTVR